MAQWIVAKWVDENSCTVISSKDVTDKDFCTDKEITVVIRSKGQVELYQAKALFISGKLELNLVIGGLSLLKPLRRRLFRGKILQIR